MNQACVRALQASSLHVVDPVITESDRKWLGVIYDFFHKTKCCDKFSECDCPSRVPGPSCLNLRAVAESICNFGGDRSHTSAGISLSSLLQPMINSNDLQFCVEFSRALSSGKNIPSPFGNSNGEILGEQLKKQNVEK